MTDKIAASLPEDALAAFGVSIDHLFTNGVCGPWYFKVSHIKAGVSLAKHTHTYDHPSVLICGDATVEVDGVPMELSGPVALVVERNREHKVTAKTDIIWICAHVTDDTDPNTVDVSLMSKVVE